jgi:hypothetical protein
MLSYLILIGVSLLCGAAVGLTALLAAKLGICGPLLIVAGRWNWLVGGGVKKRDVMHVYVLGNRAKISSSGRATLLHLPMMALYRKPIPNVLRTKTRGGDANFMLRKILLK